MTLGPQFHASVEPPNEFLRAPLLHVGTEQAAEEISKFTPNRNEYVTHELAFSDHVQFHDDNLSDDLANEAHARFLEQKGMTPTKTVSDSRSTTPMSPMIRGIHESKLSAAVEALGQNKVLRYINVAEDRGSTSHIVPAPHMNLRQMGQADPQKQPVLPMDYSGVAPSARTKRERGWQ
jgi:hypothetical protein